MHTLFLPRQKAVPTDEILYLESESNYTYIHRAKTQQKTLVALSLCRLQDALCTKQFVRVNRANLINVRFIDHYEVRRNTLALTLSNGKSFVTSRRRKDTVLNTLTNR